MTILTDDDFELFTRFKIRAMGDKLREIIDDESYDHVGFEEKIKLMPERRGPRRAARARWPGSSGRRGSNTRTRASRTSNTHPNASPAATGSNASPPASGCVTGRP